MQQFMVEVILPTYFSLEFIDLIPKQRAFINKHFQEGTITGYSLAMDRSKLWVTFMAKDRMQVDAILLKFPVNAYVDYLVHELAFHDSSTVFVPAISLN